MIKSNKNNYRIKYFENLNLTSNANGDAFVINNFDDDKKEIYFNRYNHKSRVWMRFVFDYGEILNSLIPQPYTCDFIGVTDMNLYYLFYINGTLMYVDLEHRQICFKINEFAIEFKTLIENKEPKDILKICGSDNLIVVSSRIVYIFIKPEEKIYLIDASHIINGDNSIIKFEHFNGYLISLVGQNDGSKELLVFNINESISKRRLVEHDKIDSIKSFYLNNKTKENLIVLFDYKTNLTLYDADKKTVVATVFTGIPTFKHLLYNDKYISIQTNDEEILSFMICLDDRFNPLVMKNIRLGSNWYWNGI